MTEAEQFIASQVQPHLAPGEMIQDAVYLVGFMEMRGIGEIARGISAFAGAARQRHCFIALTQGRVFFLWGKAGRVGAFSPLLECEQVQCFDRAHVGARVERVGLFGKRLVMSLASGETAAFTLKRKVAALPGQARGIDALVGAPAAGR